MSDTPFVTRVVLENYKSIARCDVRLGSLTVLVGPNGSGKSNLVDGLSFVAEALEHSLDTAFRNRGGINEVRRRSRGRPRPVKVRLELQLPDGRTGHYGFDIAPQAGRGFRVAMEECKVLGVAGGQHARFRVDGGQVTTTAQIALPTRDDRLYLQVASGLPMFGDVFDCLAGMAFYNFDPASIRGPQHPDSGDVLARDGGNLASVWPRMSPEGAARIVEYLGKILPDLRSVESETVGNWATLVFHQSTAEGIERFFATNMSDGTLRALGILVALFQPIADGGRPVPLVGIEEPEVALHPRAAGVLLDALRDASVRTQVLITSHSPDLLDDKDIEATSLLAVVLEDGETRIGPIDEAGRAAMREHLYTAGELLRLGQIRPEQQ